MAETAGTMAARWGPWAEAVTGGTSGRSAAGLAARRRQVARHLRRVYGPGIGESELGRRVDDAFASYARYWAESLRLPSVPVREIRAGLAEEGFDHLWAARSAGKGTILALPHLGGWEWGGAYLARAGVPVSVVVEAIEPPEVFEWFVGFRLRLGMDVIAVGPDAGRRCLQALADNRVLCLLCDRVVGQVPGVEVDFFGEHTALPAGPMTLAFRSGAAVLPAAVYFAPWPTQHLAVVRPPIDATRAGRLRDDVQRSTQALAGDLEVLIRRAPTQWHLMQPNWPSDRR